MTEEHGRKISIEELLEEKYREITRLYALVADRDTQIAELERQIPPSGTPVWVYSPHVEGVLPAHRLFSGHLISGAPWMFWNRVVPDGHYLDLPPMYRIEQREEQS